MKIYIWENLEKVTDRWHENGGALVIARDEAHARALIAAHDTLNVTDNEWSSAIVLDLAGAPEPRVVVFPNAGCC